MTESPIDTCLARAVLYRALADGFRRPEPESVADLGSVAGRRTLGAAARALEDGALVEALDRLPPPPSGSALRADFGRLFGHTARGEVPPYETEYGEEEIFRQAHELADLAGFFLAFGVQVPPGGHERVDHVSCECEFLSLLCTKEAYAAETGDADMLRLTRGARRLFLRDHLGRFGRAFALRVSRADADGFYGGIGRVLERLLAGELAREALPLGPDTLALRPVDLDAVPSACASCPDRPGEA